MHSLQVIIAVGLVLTAALSGGSAATAVHVAAASRSSQVILHMLSDVDGFGFGRDVCPLGCELPGEPLGDSTDPPPFDAPDTPCALTRTWTHDITADLPSGARVIAALLLVNAAGIQPEVFPSVLMADTVVFPLGAFDQGQFGSGLVPVPLELADLADGMLRVTIQKGFRTVCDKQWYDVSTLIVLIRAP